MKLILPFKGGFGLKLSIFFLSPTRKHSVPVHDKRYRKIFFEKKDFYLKKTKRKKLHKGDFLLFWFLHEKNIHIQIQPVHLRHRVST